MRGNARDLRGQRFSRLLVLDEEPRSLPVAGGTQLSWRCLCDCGQTTMVRSGALLSGRQRSCGCWRTDVATKRLTTHGGTHRPEYRAWCQMRVRCYDASNPGYKWYGARGITVCAAWRNSFAQFLADMGPRPSPLHSIERVDNARGYEPGNCVWATATTQANNSRRNRLVTWNGRTLTLAQWCRELGLSYQAVHYRLTDAGWSVERALTTH